MNEFEKFNESERRKRNNESRESREGGAEKKAEEAEKKIAARERIEQASGEIKNTKKQIQNIVANMQQVIKAVQAIRALLQVAQNDDNIPSVGRDKKNLQALQKKLAGLFGEVKDLKEALFMEERKAVGEKHPDWNAEAITVEAEARVREILTRLGIDKVLTRYWQGNRIGV